MLSKTIKLLCLCTFISSIPAVAHNVEISNQVAGTLHIEPNDNPQVGKRSQAWFALTRKGGEIIPLSECNCQLSIYSVPRSDDDKPILKPILEPINVGQYRDIPGAEIIFPKIGSYELEILGTAKNSNDFEEFELSYSVNVRP